MGAVKVVLTEDSPIVRAGIARLLGDAGIEVVGQADDVQSMLREVGRSRPDAVIMDMRMPPTQSVEGLDGAKALRTKFPAVAVLLLAQHVGSPETLRFVESCEGGIGFLLKDRVADIEVLTSSVKRVVRGETVLDPELARMIVETRQQSTALATATVRERQVLALMAEGLSNQAIADRLVLALRTVEMHVGQVLKSLGLPADVDANRRVLAVLAYLRVDDRLLG